MLYTLNLHSVTCMLYLNKAGGKGELGTEVHIQRALRAFPRNELEILSLGIKPRMEQDSCQTLDASGGGTGWRVIVTLPASQLSPTKVIEMQNGLFNKREKQAGITKSPNWED